MKARGFLLALLPLNALLAGQISLLNQDRISGEVLSLEGGMLRVGPSWGGDPLLVPAARVASFDQAVPPSSDFIADVRVEFSNGDHVEAKLLGLEDDHLLLETTWAPQARARLGTVTRMTRVDSGDKIHFRGVGAPSDWRVEGTTELRPAPPVWRDGRLHIAPRTTMGRTLPEFPERFCVEFVFTVDTGPGNFGLVLDLFAADMNQGNQPWMRLHFSRGTIFHSVQGGRRNQQVNENWRHFFPPELFEQDQWHVRIHGDFKTNRYFFEINGIPVHEWVSEAFVPPRRRTNRWVSFSWQHGVGLFALEDLVLSAWDGREPRQDPVPTQPDEVGVLLKNGDVMQVRLLGVEDQNLRVETPEGRVLSLPWRVVSRVVFSPTHSHPPRIQARDVRMFHNQRRDRLTFSLESWEEGRVTGRSDIWDGPQSLKQTAVDSVLFNIHMRDRPPVLLEPEILF